MAKADSIDLPKGGLYHLILHLNQTKYFRVGALGQHDFPVGTYIYTGSAKRGLPRRVNRHIKKEKNRRWHIDYLTSLVSIDEVIIDTSGKHSECERYRMVAELPGAEVIVRGFGSSDCRCATHLSYFKERPSLRRLLGKAGVLQYAPTEKGRLKNEPRDDRKEN